VCLRRCRLRLSGAILYPSASGFRRRAVDYCWAECQIIRGATSTSVASMHGGLIRDFSKKRDRVADASLQDVGNGERLAREFAALVRGAN